ncbi:MAG: protein-glutamate O-methyltransferase CheR [Clostridiales Family XIII bacterium]|jgi:chemotaxis protein methyltransferase CheR|nr:protein-glutamate O-methyltransferase CheR [Clostridiales Family XIII bacterium]
MTTLTEQELADIASYVKEHYGVNLAKKSSLIEGRLGFHITARGFPSYGAYFDFVKQDPSGREMADMINRLTTNHTYFLRESDHFEYFVGEVMPWIESLPGSRDLRTWCAGCSTGEEPYGLSVYLLDYLAAHGLTNTWDSVILASDISEKVLSDASEGIYTEENLSAMSKDRIQKYFTSLGDGLYKVTPTLRQNVAFRKINLLESFEPKTPFHAIFCRNVMIYFDTETKVNLVNRFYDAILPGGYLFIGHSESLTTFEHRFQYIKPSIYRKK